MFFLMIPRPPTSTRTDTPFPYPTRFRSTELDDRRTAAADAVRVHEHLRQYGRLLHRPADRHRRSPARDRPASRSEEHTSELQSLMRISYAVFCSKNKKTTLHNSHTS